MITSPAASGALIAWGVVSGVQIAWVAVASHSLFVAGHLKLYMQDRALPSESRALRRQLAAEQRFIDALAILESRGWTVLYDRWLVGTCQRLPAIAVGPAGVLIVEATSGRSTEAAQRSAAEGLWQALAAELRTSQYPVIVLRPKSSMDLLRQVAALPESVLPPTQRFLITVIDESCPRIGLPADLGPAGRLARRTATAGD